MALKQKREQTIFQKQLEKAATRNIVFLVFIGCLFFSAAIFGINYLNTRFNVQEHIEFLTSTFQTAYYATDSYLNDTENDSFFTRCIEDGTNGSEVHYSLSKYNVDSPIRLNLILARAFFFCVVEQKRQHSRKRPRPLSHRLLFYRGHLGIRLLQTPLPRRRTYRVRGRLFKRP